MAIALIAAVVVVVVIAVVAVVAGVAADEQHRTNSYGTVSTKMARWQT